jgi:hypothetical protein
MRTWGYSGEVGEWSGTVAVPPEERQPPVSAAIWLVCKARALLGPMHRPRDVQITWGDFDRSGQEIAFHESDRFAAANWSDVVVGLNGISERARGRFALSSLFVELDTAIIEDGATTWAESAAELQISIPSPETDAAEANVSYRTFIDIWLERTRGAEGEWRSNARAAADNASRLAAILRGFRDLAGETYRVGGSFHYHEFIRPTGFALE